MKNMEIERKFLIKELPDLNGYKCKKLVQGYLNTAPVVRVRQEGEAYFLTYKSGGLMERKEYNLPLDKASFEHLLPKCDGNIISKTRYLIPQGSKDFPCVEFSDGNTGNAKDKETDLVIELDIFDKPFENLMIAEVEFQNKEEALSFEPPSWFEEDVTNNPFYHNSNLSRLTVKAKEPS